MRILVAPDSFKGSLSATDVLLELGITEAPFEIRNWGAWICPGPQTEHHALFVPLRRIVRERDVEVVLDLRVALPVPEVPDRASSLGGRRELQTRKS